MTGFEWTSDFEIGHAEIDEQHRRMLSVGKSVMELLVGSGDNKIDTIQLQKLIDCAQEHFASEERLMFSVGYPQIDRHAKYHASLLAELKTYCFKAQRDQQSDPVGLMDFFRDWFVLQINAADRDLVAWLNDHAPDGGR